MERTSKTIKEGLQKEIRVAGSESALMLAE